MSRFKDKDYGEGIKEYVIGIICVAPVFDSFFKIRKNYTESKRLLEYDIKLDHAKFKKANNKEIYEMLRQEVLNSLGIVEELKIKDFDLARFRADLEQFFAEHTYLGEMEKFDL
ncbi:MAG: Imm44 family immunity protein [Bacillota bacterium]